MNLHKIMIGIGIVLLLAVPIWTFFIVPELLKINSDWNFELNFEGTTNWADENGKFSMAEFNLYKRTNKILEDKGKTFIIEDNYIIFNPATKNINWESNSYFEVNKKTKKNIDFEKFKRENTYFNFPRKTNKEEYTLSWSYIENYQFNFVKEDIIEGLNTYIFEYSGYMEFTNAYKGTEEYPGVNVEFGQEIACKDMNIQLWIEPISGEIVKLHEGCKDGDSIYDSKTKTKIRPILIWEGKTTKETILNRVRLAQNEKQRIYLIKWITPILLALVGIAFIFSSFIGGKYIENEKPISPKSKPIKKIEVKKTEVKKSPEKPKKPLVTFDKKEGENEA